MQIANLEFREKIKKDVELDDHDNHGDMNNPKKIIHEEEIHEDLVTPPRNINYKDESHKEVLLIKDHVHERGDDNRDDKNHEDFFEESW